MGLDQDRVRCRGGRERRAQPGLVDPVVVAVDASLPERHAGRQVVVEVVGAGEPPRPQVDPRAVVEPRALDLDPGGQLHRRCRLCHSDEGTGDAGARSCPASVPDTLGGMCRRVTCKTCGKPNWAGCGAHVDAVLGDVPKKDRCRCAADKASAKAAAKAAKGSTVATATKPSLRQRLFGS